TSTRARKANTPNSSRPTRAQGTDGLERKETNLPRKLNPCHSARKTGELEMRYLVTAALAASIASTAFAQNQPAAAQLPSPQDVSNRDTLTIGVGAAIMPDYEGSDDYRIIPAGAVRGQYHRISFTTRGSYLYVDVIPR